MNTLIFAVVLSATTALAGNPRLMDNIFIPSHKQPPKVAAPHSTHQPQQFKSKDNQQNRAG